MKAEGGPPSADPPDTSASRLFLPEQMPLVAQAVAMAEELVGNHYKMTTSGWQRPRYDVRTYGDLEPSERVSGPFAQIIRYHGRPRRTELGSAGYDFYKICLQDPAILEALDRRPGLRLLPFLLYILVHELIHVVRFSRFQMGFEASEEERLAEERRVHRETHAILRDVRLEGMREVLEFYADWHASWDLVEGPS